MIVPSNRLLWGVGLLVVPLAAVATAFSGGFWPSLVATGVFSAAVLADGFLAARSIRAVGVSCRPAARMSKGRTSHLEFLVASLDARPKRVALAPAFPPAVVPSGEVASGDLSAGGTLRLTWEVTPVARGRHRLDHCHVEASSPLGFWAGRRAVAIELEIRVYPNLFAERKHVAALFLNRGSFGVHSQRRVGQGREFEKLRDYVPGDSPQDIHWKATAKRGRPVSKVFQIERTQEVYVLVDGSRLSGRPGMTGASGDGAAPETTAERFVTAALILALAAERQGDLFGLVTFSDRIHSFIRARSGKDHFGTCRDALYTFEPRPVTPDFAEVLQLIGLRLRRRALLVFLTSLDDPALAESFTRNVEIVCRQHLVLVNMLRPVGAAPLFSDAAVHHDDDLYLKLAGHLRWRNLRELQKLLGRRGVRFAVLDHETACPELVSQYLDIKQRQLL